MRIKIFGIIGCFLILLSSCKQERNLASGIVLFDVGFENVSMHHGVIYNVDSQEEEIFFVKTEFGPHIDFFDLDGVFKNSFSLTKLESDFGRIGHVSLTTSDSLIVQFYASATVVGTTKEGNIWFQTNLYNKTDSMGYTYKYYNSFLPAPIFVDDEVILLSCWEPHDDDPMIREGFDSYFDLYSFFNNNRAKTSQLSKLGSLSQDEPVVTYGLQGFYGKIFDGSRVYQDMIVRYTVLNDKLFYMNPYSRHLYVLDRGSLDIRDSICVIPHELTIPEGIELTVASSERDLFEEADKERKEKAQIVNLLYNREKEKFYLFLKTGVDHSQVDEMGYSFVIYTYDPQFNKLDEIEFNTDIYLPHSAVMTSRGIFVEKVDNTKEYGKRIFEIFDL